MTTLDSPTTTDFAGRVAAYRNDAETNDAVHRIFTEETASVAYLAEHRAHVEANKLGFGDPAFHAMWRSLLLHLATERTRPRTLEIGVFKGQVLSLWALIAAREGLSLNISAVTPLAGQPLPPSVWSRRWRWLINPSFRAACRAGNFYPDEDYGGIVRSLFERFDVRFDDVVLHRGFTTDAAVRGALSEQEFDLIYIDGDHTFEGATADVNWFAPKVSQGGFLVMDDSSYFLPGTGFWKGYESVSRAAELVPALGFENVLNVGHNRIFCRKS